MMTANSTQQTSISFFMILLLSWLTCRLVYVNGMDGYVFSPIP
jgi:hypothetical protein